ncbi:hypothetical protein AAES_50680 [Amazona aestiva]|uniref:Uncharacterized protein n=1 Tax=Amazona aestiva TaxID=12930 RepID=A0A0Q3PSN0_AMAAE|nr:hypothetical protein AAES_50680 [Amazona aestiva]
MLNSRIYLNIIVDCSVIKMWKSGDEMVVALQQPQLTFFRTQGVTSDSQSEGFHLVIWSGEDPWSGYPHSASVLGLAGLMSSAELVFNDIFFKVSLCGEQEPTHLGANPVLNL